MNPSSTGRTQDATPAPDIPDQITATADLALEHGRMFVAYLDDERHLLVPDVVLVECTANGNPAPPSWTLERADGRTVAIYRVPAEMVL